MATVEQLVTDHLDLWTAAIKRKSAAGRGSSSKVELYGIKKLRELILELAVRGLLVPQDPKDEPASELLKKIAAEKAKLVKEGKTKKDKSLPRIAAAEIPFDLPNEWCWARLGEVTNYGFSDKAEQADVNEDTWVLELEDVEKVTSRLLRKIRFFEREFKSSKNIFKAGDVIYGKLRPYLDKVLVADEDGVCTTEMIPTRAYASISPEFLRLSMKSPQFIEYAKNATHGMNLPRVGTDKARLALMPICCEAEQHRIVAKVDELMALCDQLEQQTDASLSAHQTLVETLLDALTSAANHAQFASSWQRIAEHFDTLFTTEDSIAQLKQTLLQLAVMGKLVPQDPNDEPACVLLERMEKERKKLLKQGILKKLPQLPELDSAKKSIALPMGWSWGFIPQVVANDKYAIKRGPFGSAIKKDFFVPTGYKVYEQQHAIRDDFSLGDYYISEDKFNELRAFEVKPNDIIISCSGTVGKVAVAPSWMEPGVINQALLKLTLNESALSNDYFKILFPAYYMRTETLSELQGTAQKNMVSVETLKEEAFPLPPLAEQHRIVAKVDELFALCDQLKSRLCEAQTTQLHLADAIVEQAVC